MVQLPNTTWQPNQRKEFQEDSILSEMPKTTSWTPTPPNLFLIPFLLYPTTANLHAQPPPSAESSKVLLLLNDEEKFIELK